MLVGDLIYNNDFDVNCGYKVYKVEEDQCWDEGILVYEAEECNKPYDSVLDLKITYITWNFSENCLVIEAKKNN